MFPEVTIYGKNYVIKPSTKRYKKYDVFLDDRKITSFGDTRYQQYKDKFGYYSDLNHFDKFRRKNYRTRHQHDYIDDPNHAGFWSYWFLW